MSENEAFDPAKQAPQKKPSSDVNSQEVKSAKDSGVIDELFEKHIKPIVEKLEKTWDGAVHEAQTIKVNTQNKIEEIKNILNRSSNEVLPQDKYAQESGQLSSPQTPNVKMAQNANKGHEV